MFVVTAMIQDEDNLEPEMGESKGKRTYFFLDGHFSMTGMMEKLPTELMQEVMKYSDKPTIHSFTVVSSKYCEIARPLIFRRISISITTNNERFALFVEQMQNSSKLALMIKVLVIRTRYSTKLLRHLFKIISNLEELRIKCPVASSLLSPHYFPNLRSLHVPFYKPRFFDHIITNFIPRHQFLNILNIPFVPSSPTSYRVTLSTLPPAESAVATSVNRLVTYHGPTDLLRLLTRNSSMQHFTSSHQLGEGTLRKLSRVVSRRLLSLIIDDPMDPTHYQTLLTSLIPSLFPNLRSIAWLSIDDTTASVIDQLPHLRRIWLHSTHSRGLPESVQAFITGIIELSAKKNRPLREIRLYAPGGNPSSHTYSKRSAWSHEEGLPVNPFVS